MDGLAIDTNSLTINENVAAAPNPNIQVIATRSNLPYMFGRLLGLTSYKVAAFATAADPPVSAAQGVFPMGMQCKNPCDLSKLVPGSPVPFDVKFTPAEGGSPGNWQWLNNGNGASGLGSAIAGGMSGTYSVGGTISSKPGNKANSNQVKTPWDNRFTTSNCPASQDPCSGGTVPPQGSPCLVTVPAVDFAGCTGTCSMTIEAFAQIYIEPSSTTSSIHACYVKAADINAIGGSSTATNLGATLIRLYQ